MTTADIELAVVRHVLSRVRSTARRLAWGRAMNARAIRIATILRMLRRIVRGRQGGRTKTKAGWIVTIEEAGATVHAATVITQTPGRTIQQLAAAIHVAVRRPDLLDLRLLHELVERGLVQVVLEGNNEHDAA